MFSPFYNSHHSPIGAFASFTLGAKGAQGGLGLELGRPSCSSIYIGAEAPEGGTFFAFPFYKVADKSAAEDYTIDSPLPQRAVDILHPFSDESINRVLTPNTDVWESGDLTFSLYSPALQIPDPDEGDSEALRLALIPAVIAELTLDNSKGEAPRLLFLGSSNPDPFAGMRQFSTDKVVGFTLGLHMALAASQGSGVTTGGGFGPEQILQPEAEGHRAFGLGEAAMLLATVAPGETKTIRLAACFFRPGPAVGGLEAKYLYTRWWSSLEDVAAEALERFDEIKEACLNSDKALHHEGMNPAQEHMLAMAIKSYYGSSQLLEEEEKPLWVINEGEYRMMNTFDLTVDQLFYELKMSPWTVKNVLDQYSRRYSYREEIGGIQAIAFTHDMGVSNQFSRPGHSSYEIPRLTGCFSYMSHEELVNWVLCAGLYVHEVKDEVWRKQNQTLFLDCLASLEVRDNPDPLQRDGIMSVDDPRCQGGAEITTYDSLDASLGQARASAYLALKTSASYAFLERCIDDSEAKARAHSQAVKGLETLAAWKRPEGVFPALLEEGCESFTIPVIEGLVFFDRGGMWEDWIKEPSFANLLPSLKDHVRILLNQGLCLFPDRGWRLSSTSNNSWLSKIYLCQHIARKILGFGGLDAYRMFDYVHASWLHHPESVFWAWSDQMVSGVARGSRYYPRGVTAILWLEEEAS